MAQDAVSSFQVELEEAFPHVDPGVEIYRITNKVTGKSYIGVTSTGSAKRWTRHLMDCRKNVHRPLYHSMNKHGVDSFVIEVIDRAIDWQDGLRKEVEYIEKLGTLFPGGYNITLGGEGTKGFVPPDWLRAKWSEARKGHEWAAEQNSARSTSMKAKWRDEGFRSARVVAMSGRRWSDEQRKARSEAMKGRPFGAPAPHYAEVAA